VHGVVLVFCLVVIVGSWAFNNSEPAHPKSESPVARGAGAPIAK
jgi:hypothetical protein